jgi:hypothetical protein
MQSYEKYIKTQRLEYIQHSKIKEDKKDICLKGISNFKESLKKYLIVEQKHIILIVEDFEKKIARELTIDLNIFSKIN